MLRLGVIGTAKIANAFLNGVSSSERIQVTAIASRELGRAKAFADKYNIPNAFGAYEELLAHPDVDAVYIPLPNSLHSEWSIRAAEAGKHILCEKPIALSVKDIDTMFYAAEANCVILMEGFPYQSQPQTLEMLRLVRDGAIGDVANIYADFGFPVSGSGTDIRLNPDLGGGCLWDCGVYPVSLIQLITGTAPTYISATGTFDKNGVDTSVGALLRYQNGITAQLNCNFYSTAHRFVRVIGTNGSINCGYYNHTEPGTGFLEVKFGNSKDYKMQKIEFSHGNGFMLETSAFYDLIKKGDASDQSAARDRCATYIQTASDILEAARKNHY